MTYAIVIFYACHDPSIYYLLFYTLHRNEVGVDGAEARFAALLLVSFGLYYILFEEQL